MSHLYFHVPFCRRRCSYCDFSIAVRKRIPAREYVEAVKAELDAIRVSSGWVNPGAPSLREGPRAHERRSSAYSFFPLRSSR